MEGAELQEKLEKARAKLMHKSPFFSMLAVKLLIDFKDEGPSSFDGKSLTLNAQWATDASLTDLMFIWAESAIKSALLHPFRMGRRDKKIWSKASSIVTKPILEETFTIPPGYPARGDLQSESIEKVYETLLMEESQEKNQRCGGGGGGGGNKNNNKQNSGQGGGQGGDGQQGQGQSHLEIEDGRNTGNMSQGEFEEKENEWPMDLTAAAMMAKGIGSASHFVQMILDSVEVNRIDWRDKLRQCLDEWDRNDYNFYSPDRRYAGESIIMPSLKSPSRAKIGVLLDVSGSMSNEDVQNAMAEVSSIISDYQAEATCIQFDTKILSVDHYKPRDLPIKNIRSGCGGTNIIPPFKKIDELSQESGFNILIIFTDMGLMSFPEEYPEVDNIIWVVNGHRNPEKDYGDKVQGDILNLSVEGEYWQ